MSNPDDYNHLVSNFDTDIQYLAQLMLASSSIETRLDFYRRIRVRDMQSRQTVTPLAPSAILALHVIPAEIPMFAIDITSNEIMEQVRSLTPLSDSIYSLVRNFDGFLYTDSPARNTEHTRSYVQIFRNGIFEYGDTTFARSIDQGEHSLSFISAERIENSIIQCLSKTIGFFKTNSIEPPAFTGISLAGVTNYALATGNQQHLLLDPKFIDRDAIFLPMTRIDSWDLQVDDALKTSFDLIWQAWGYQRSRFYNSEGRRIKPQA